MKSNPTSSFAIDPSGFMAMAEGLGKVITGTEAHEINSRIRAKYLTEAAVDSVGEAWGTVDERSVEITPLRWRSWSSAALTSMSAEAAGDLPPGEWWVPE